MRSHRNGHRASTCHRKVLTRGGLSAQDLDVIEINEAFSSQALACLRELDLDTNKVNLDGGALALGHPLGATGARITGKAAALLHAKVSAMHWPRNASAADKASQRSLNRFNQVKGIASWTSIKNPAQPWTSPSNF